MPGPKFKPTVVLDTGKVAGMRECYITVTTNKSM